VNVKSTKINGMRLGVFIIHNLPIVTKLMSQEQIEKRIKKFRKKRANLRTSKKNYGKRFTPSPKLILYPGMPVMLRINLCPALGLSNGSIGTIRSVLYNNVPPIESDEAVVDRILSTNDNCTFVPSVLVDFKNYYKGKLSALKSESSSSINRNENVVLIEPQTSNGIRGLPLTPAHSITMHKSQSLTIPFCIIDPSNTFAMGQLYVAFSRAPGLNNIALKNPVTTKLLNKYKNTTERITNKLLSIKEHSVSFTPFCNYLRTQNEFDDII